jgi:hypothetical protein
VTILLFFSANRAKFVGNNPNNSVVTVEFLIQKIINNRGAARQTKTNLKTHFTQEKWFRQEKD